MSQNTAAQFPLQNVPLLDAQGRLNPAWQALFIRLWQQSFSTLDTNLTPQQLLEQAAQDGALLVCPGNLPV